MEFEVVRSQVQDENDEQQPFNAASQLKEQHNDPQKKSSVLNKVKERAKKIKDTVKKHGQRVLDHVHDNNNNSEDQNSPHHHHINEVDRALDSVACAAKFNKMIFVSGCYVVGESEGILSDPPTYVQVEDFVKSAEPEPKKVENLDKSVPSSGGTTAFVGEE
ncbi:hypothetical protein PIB30_081341 [Stylosanthes scabra]|uniref:LTI65/LTI78 N-terminal domain-containing protein n=1 Tax=Stylosanthes scabra TaxID=79078 RepID=A0ABU6STW0_9FABA|nr:hypothetical protein [Stylosanthes scabra]